jgi:hypothetical protein
MMARAALVVLVSVAALLLASNAKSQCRLGETPTRAGGCMPEGGDDCGGGNYCPPGEKCRADGRGCTGNPPTGPVCSPGVRCRADQACHPHSGNCYYPKTEHPCDLRICTLDEECGPNGTCLPK